MARARRTSVIVTSLGYRPEFEEAAFTALLQRQVLGLIACPISRGPVLPRPVAAAHPDGLRGPGTGRADGGLRHRGRPRRRAPGRDPPARPRAPAHRLHRRRSTAPRPRCSDSRATGHARGSRYHVRRDSWSTSATPPSRRSTGCSPDSPPCRSRRQRSSHRTPGAPSASTPPCSDWAARAWPWSARRLPDGRLTPAVSRSSTRTRLGRRHLRRGAALPPDRRTRQAAPSSDTALRILDRTGLLLGARRPWEPGRRSPPAGQVRPVRRRGRGGRRRVRARSRSARPAVRDGAGVDRVGAVLVDPEPVAVRGPPQVHTGPPPVNPPGSPRPPGTCHRRPGQRSTRYRTCIRF